MGLQNVEYQLYILVRMYSDLKYFSNFFLKFYLRFLWVRNLVSDNMEGT
jgi:hypothetical protein